MLDNQLIKIFLPIINNGLIGEGLVNVSVRQNYQPTNQGIKSGQSVYFFKVSDERRGTVGVREKFDALNSLMIREEITSYESTFQVSAYSIQDPTDTDQLTASDLVNVVSEILQRENTVQTLTANSIGILRIGQIRNPYFINERNNFEASPSFDFVLSHNQTRVTEIPVVESIKKHIYTV